MIDPRAGMIALPLRTQVPHAVLLRAQRSASRERGVRGVRAAAAARGQSQSGHGQRAGQAVPKPQLRHSHRQDKWVSGVNRAPPPFRSHVLAWVLRAIVPAAGCNAMKCTRCNQGFCWLCGKAVEAGEFPNHFKWWNLRGCPNKQVLRFPLIPTPIRTRTRTHQRPSRMHSCGAVFCCC